MVVFGCSFVVILGFWWGFVVLSGSWQVFVVFGGLWAVLSGSCWFLLFCGGSRASLVNIGGFWWFLRLLMIFSGS